MKVMHKALAADRTRAATRSLFAVHRPGAIDGRAAEAHRLAVALHGRLENHSWRGGGLEPGGCDLKSAAPAKSESATEASRTAGVTIAMER